MKLHIEQIHKGDHFWEMTREFEAICDGRDMIDERGSIHHMVAGRLIETGEKVCFMESEGYEQYAPCLDDHCDHCGEVLDIETTYMQCKKCGIL